ILSGRRNEMRGYSSLLNDRAHILQFVRLLLLKVAAESVLTLTSTLSCELAVNRADDRRTVQPSRETRADGHIAPKMQPHTLSHQPPGLARCLGERDIRLDP